MAFADLLSGPVHQPHAPQRQIGWVGHRAGDFYPWHQPPGVHAEPGGYTPVYVDEPED